MTFSLTIGRRVTVAPVADLAVPVTAAVLGPPRASLAIAAALALRLAARNGAGCALVLTEDRRIGPRLPATGTASSGARTLVSRGITAVAGGRLIRAQLDDLVGFGRAAAVVDGPAVLVLSRARTLELDAVLGGMDALLVCGGDDSYTALAVDSLRVLGPPVARIAPSRAPLAAAWAIAGLGAPAPLGAAVDAVQTGVPA